MTPAQQFAERLAMLDEQFEQREGWRIRAAKIVDRVLPPLGRTPHGFFEPQAFNDAVRYEGWRSTLFWIVFARLRAKAEGTTPCIGVPKVEGQLFRGGSMEAASKLLEMTYGKD